MINSATYATNADENRKQITPRHGTFRLRRRRGMESLLSCSGKYGERPLLHFNLEARFSTFVHVYSLLSELILDFQKSTFHHSVVLSTIRCFSLGFL